MLAGADRGRARAAAASEEQNLEQALPPTWGLLVAWPPAVSSGPPSGATAPPPWVFEQRPTHSQCHHCAHQCPDLPASPLSLPPNTLFQELMRKWAPGVGAGLLLERAISRKAGDLTAAELGLPAGGAGAGAAGMIGAARPLSMLVDARG